MRATASAHGWHVSANTDLVDGVGRPKIAAGLADLLKQDIPAANLCHTQWCFLSAVSHSTVYGLLEAVLPPSAPDVTGLSFAAMYPKATTALTQAIVLMAALRCTAQRRFRLLGWDDDVWRAQCIATRNYEATLVNVALPQLFA